MDSRGSVVARSAGACAAVRARTRVGGARACARVSKLCVICDECKRIACAPRLMQAGAVGEQDLAEGPSGARGHETVAVFTPQGDWTRQLLDTAVLTVRDKRERRRGPCLRDSVGKKGSG